MVLNMSLKKAQNNRVKVYRNLTKDCYSVVNCKTGLVVNHVKSICLADCVLRVRPAGRERVIKEQCKNVHAYVSGFITDPPQKDKHWIKITYDPYKYYTFVNFKTKDPIYKAEYVHLTETEVKALIIE